MTREEIPQITDGCLLYSAIWGKVFRVTNVKFTVNENYNHATFTAIEELPERVSIQLSFSFVKTPNEPRQKIEGLCCSHCCAGSWSFHK